MPIVDPEIIKSGENELFASIVASIDEFRVEELFQENYNFLLKEKMRFKKGRTTVHNNQIAFQLFFSSVAQISLLLDESGKFNGFANLSDMHSHDAELNVSHEQIIDSEVIKMRKSEFLESLSASINVQTINELLEKIYRVRPAGKTIYSHGDLKIFNDNIVYQLVYEVYIIFSILIDREGNYINTSLKNSE